MRPRLTWNIRRWSEAAWVAEITRLRSTYGHDVAEAVEMVAHMVKDRLDRPTAQDIKHTLRRIASRPATSNLSRLDGYTSAMLATVSQRQHGTTSYRRLQHEQLAECARLALELPLRGSGTNSSDDLALVLVRALLHVMPACSPTDRDKMLSDALCACHLGAGKKTVERLITKAKRGQVR